MTRAQDDAEEVKFWQSPWAIRAASTLISATLAALSASWAVRSYLSDRDAQLAARFAEIDKKSADRFAEMDKKTADRFADVEKRAAQLDSITASHADNIRRLNAEIVPRTEHEQYWKLIEHRLDEIHDDIKEVRKAQEKGKP